VKSPTIDYGPFARATRLALVLLLFLAACAAPAGSGFGGGSVLRSLDNDAVAGSDDHYTHGFHVAYMGARRERFEDGPVPTALGRRIDDVWPFEGEELRTTTLSLSQRLFTPSDIDTRTPDPRDQPYAGLLYGTAAFASQSVDRLHAATVSLGLVGPGAGGEDTQQAVHRVIDAAHPLGWDEQVPNEPLFGVTFEERRRIARFESNDALGLDALVGAFGALGNLQTSASLGAAVRFGFDLPRNFQMPTPFLWDESTGLRAFDPPRGFSIHVFAGAVLSAVAHTVQLDGALFRDGPSVAYDRLQPRTSVGVAVQSGSLLLTVSQEFAPIAFDHPDGIEDEEFLRVALSFDF
jgi:hypothetical protein